MRISDWSSDVCSSDLTLIVGSASAILLAACVLPLLWPLIGLATGGRGVDLGLIADPALWSLLARTLVVTAAVLALALGIGLPMAVLVARTDVIGRGAVLALHAFPRSQESRVGHKGVSTCR